jgi:hypothetical protein
VGAIFLIPAALNPAVAVVDPPDLRVWVSVPGGRVECIHQMNPQSKADHFEELFHIRTSNWFSHASKIVQWASRWVASEKCPHFHRQTTADTASAKN